MVSYQNKISEIGKKANNAIEELVKACREIVLTAANEIPLKYGWYTSSVKQSHSLENGPVSVELGFGTQPGNSHTEWSFIFYPYPNLVRIKRHGHTEHSDCSNIDKAAIKEAIMSLNRKCKNMHKNHSRSNK